MGLITSRKEYKASLIPNEDGVYMMAMRAYRTKARRYRGYPDHGYDEFYPEQFAWETEETFRDSDNLLDVNRVFTDFLRKYKATRKKRPIRFGISMNCIQGNTSNNRNGNRYEALLEPKKYGVAYYEMKMSAIRTDYSNNCYVTLATQEETFGDSDNLARVNEIYTAFIDENKR